MASLRLCFVNSVLRSTTRIEANNISVIFRRTNHSLCKSRLITVVNQDSPKLFSNLRRYWLIYRLEHGIPASSNITSVINDIVQGSESPKSNQTKQIVESVSGAGNINDSKKGIENLNPFDDSVLPPIPEPGTTVLEEATLHSLGLTGWSPPGIVLQILEFFHISFNMPWWAAIVGLTLTLRIFMVPFTIKMRRDMINYSNNMPQYQHLQNKIAEARNSGSYYEVAQSSQELMQFLQEKKLFSFGMLVPYFIQMPLFLSVYLALKRMSETPELRSFETGGILWFTDLSVPDQFYILPFMTAGTLWLTVKFGGSGEVLKSSAQHVQKVMEIVIPAVVFLVTMHFPAATVCYWTTTNFFVLLQNYILSLESIRKYLSLPLRIVDVPKKTDVNKYKGVVDGFRESYRNMKIAREIEDRERLNAIRFEQNSSSAVRRTYKFNPQQIPNLTGDKKKK